MSATLGKATSLLTQAQPIVRFARADRIAARLVDTTQIAHVADVRQVVQIQHGATDGIPALTAGSFNYLTGRQSELLGQLSVADGMRALRAIGDGLYKPGAGGYVLAEATHVPGLLAIGVVKAPPNITNTVLNMPGRRLVDRFAVSGSWDAPTSATTFTLRALVTTKALPGV